MTPDNPRDLIAKLRAVPGSTRREAAELIAETIRRVDGSHSMGAGELGEHIEAALRAHGLLSEGAPSEEQQRGLRKLDQVQAILAGAQTGVTDAMRELSLASAALTAAGVAPQAPVNGVATSPERVKESARFFYDSTGARNV